MKKEIYRLITILILMVMCLEVVLPTKNCYADSSYAIYGDDRIKIELDTPKRIENDSGEVEYIYIPSETGWYGFDLESLHLVNSEDIIYYIDENGKRATPSKNELGNIYLVAYQVYHFYGIGGKVQAILGFKKAKQTTLETVEAMIAKLIYSIASGLHYLVGAALGGGEAITINDLVFNQYDETKLSFYEKEGSGGSTLIHGDGETNGLDVVIKQWYNIFMRIALMGYMAILVYMGVRIMFSSTAEKKADYKRLFVDWVIGITILLLFPYVIKSMIEINNAFVKTIEANKGDFETKKGEIATGTYYKEFVQIYIDYEIDWSKGTDYMSVMGDLAMKTQKITLSVVFLIMTWQLMALIFFYYKRLFMVAFLIIIFPLVALSYAVDKVADGKSQAFNTWAKELMLNIFVQSFHAIVYVFTCCTVYSAAGVTDNGVDYILIIIGVSFLNKGEDIIRRIFGQVSGAGTMSSLKDSTAATLAKVKIAQGAIKAVGDYTVGKKSVAQKLYRGGMSLAALNARDKAFDKTATKEEEYNIGARLEGAPEPPGENATEEEKKNFKNEMKAYNAAAIYNNPKSHSLAERAMAEKTLKDLAKNDPNHKAFDSLYASVGQIQALSTLDYDVQQMMASGMSRVDIERNVTARLGIIFPGETEEMQKDRLKTYFTDMYINGSYNSVSKGMVRKEIDDILQEVKDVQNSIEFKDIDRVLDDMEKASLDRTIEDDTNEILAKYDIDESEKDLTKEYARNIAILKQRSSGVYSEADILTAASYLRDHSHDNEAITEMMEEDFGMDVDMFMHALARKVTDEPNSASQDIIDRARGIADDYENNDREGYFDDEVSVHQIIKNKSNSDELDRILEETYEKRQEVMKEETSAFAKEFLVQNEVDIMENHHDTTRLTQSGDTREEILAQKISAIGNTLSSLANVTGESGSNDYSWLDLLGKLMMQKKEEERTGIETSIKEKKRAWLDMETTDEYIKKNQAERQRIDHEHFTGDIPKDDE